MRQSAAAVSLFSLIALAPSTALAVTDISVVPDSVSGENESELRIEALVFGDFDGDGQLDMAVGCCSDAPGQVAVISPVETGHGHVTTSYFNSVVEIRGDGDFDEFGTALAVADLNGDTRDDLIVGAPGANSGAGEVVIFFGLPDLSIWELQYPHNGAIHIESPTAGTRLGEAVAGGEFLASTANDEVIACAPGWNGPGNLGEGGLLIWGEVNLGPALDIGSADMGFVGEQSLCSSLIVAPDLDGTGNPDLIVGDAHVQDPTGEPFGAIYVVDGEDGIFPVRRIDSVATRVIRGGGDTRAMGERLSLLGGVGLGGGVHVVGSAPATEDGRGAVYVFDVDSMPAGGEYGPGDAMASITGEDSGDYVGRYLRASPSYSGSNEGMLWISAPGADLDVDGSGALGLVRGAVFAEAGTDLSFKQLPGMFRGSVQDGSLGKLIGLVDGNGDDLYDLFVVEPGTAYGTLWVLPADGVTDDDGDGWFAPMEDCADLHPGAHPFAQEVCDGVDTDCVGGPEEDEIDEDGDDFLACEECDDGDAAVHPDADEDCGDGVDNDCDGDVDGDDADCSGDDDTADDDDTSGDDDTTGGDDDDDDDTAGDDDVTGPSGFACRCRSAGGGPGPAGLLLVLAGVLARRRR